METSNRPSSKEVSNDVAAPEQAPAAIRFEALEPRVLLSGDVNPAAIAIDGTLATPGQENHFQFSLEDDRKVILDSLTDRADITWSLSNASGAIASSAFAYTESNTGALDLGAGTYTLTVSGTADAVGSYALRIVDAQTAAPIALGQDTAGTLQHGNDTAVYRFDASAGQKFSMVTTALAGTNPQASWRLIDPNGEQERYGTGMDTTTAGFSTRLSGAYLLLVDGPQSNTGPVDFGFKLSRVDDLDAALTLDQATTVTAPLPSQSLRYHFDVDTPRSVLFENLGNGDYYWTLTGPNGFTSNRLGGDYGLDYGKFALDTGSYTLTLERRFSDIGTLHFAMHDLDASPVAVDGKVVSGTLDAAGSSSVVRLAVQRGQNYDLSALTASTDGATYRIFDTRGRSVLGSTALSSAGTRFTAQASGEYIVVISGGSNDPSTPTTFGFRFQAVPDVVKTLDAGSFGAATAVAGTLALPGQRTVYRFHLDSATALAFDGRLGNGIYWTLDGNGASSFGQRQLGSDSILRFLDAGDYTLTIDAIGNGIGDFAFAILALPSAPPIALDAPVAIHNDTANQTRAYRFSAEAGDHFTVASSINSYEANWRIVDSYGNIVVDTRYLGYSSDSFDLARGGDYTLLVDAGAPNEFTLTLKKGINTPPAALADGDAIDFGTVAAGTFDRWDETRTLRFSVPSDGVYVLDNQADYSSATWTLIGPGGTAMDTLTISSYGDRVLFLRAGDYALTLQGATYDGGLSRNGAYALRVVDASASQRLAFNQSTQVTHPGNASTPLRIDVPSAGGVTVFSDNYADYAMYDGFGRAVPGNYDNITGGVVYNLTAGASYYLLARYQPSGSQTEKLTIAMVDRSTTALPMNDVVSGTLTGRAEVDSYTFTIDQPRYVHFDTLSGGTSTDLRWNLVDSYGQVFYNQTSTTSDTVGIWLAAGQYTLSLRTIGDLPRDYRFRLLDGSVTPEVQPGALVASSAPGDQIRLFHVQGIAGQNLYMVPSADYSIGSWALYGPTGNIVANSYYGFSTFPDIALTQTGQYTLVLQPSTNTPATVAMPFTIGVRQQTNTTAVLNSDIAGSVPSMGGSILYGFTIDSQQLVSFVGSAAKYGTLWSLVGPGGAVFSSRDFQNGAITQRLAAGNYTLAVQRQGLDTDDFSFRIVTAADRTALSTGTPIPATTDKPTTRAYSVDITDGNYAVALTTSGSASWTLYDRKGNTVASGRGNSTSTSLALAAGNYSLLVNSNGSVDQPITSTVTMLALTTVTRELLPGTPVHDRLDVPGQSTVYQFSIGAPDIVLIDALLASPGVQWTLTGPTGAIAGGWSLDLGSRSVLTLPAAGTYRLAISSSLGVAMPIGFNLRLFSALSPVTTDFAHPLDLATGAGSTVLRVDAGNRDALRLDANADFGLTATVYDMRGNNTGIQRSVGAGDTLSFTLPGEGTWFVLVTGNGNDTP